MEQHRTRPPQNAARRRTPPLPPQAGRGRSGGSGGRNGSLRGRPPALPRPTGATTPRPARAAASAPRPAPPRAALGRRLPNPRLTGLGCGLLSGALMLLFGWLDRVLLGGSPTVYGVLFLPVCVLTAVWVHRGNLLSAPVVLPIAFAVGLLPVAEGGDGFGSRAMALITALATQAGWLYGGTLAAGMLVLVRQVRRVRRARRRARDLRRPPAPPPARR